MREPWPLYLAWRAPSLFLLLRIGVDYQIQVAQSFSVGAGEVRRVGCVYALDGVPDNAVEGVFVCGIHMGQVLGEAGEGPAFLIVL